MKGIGLVGAGLGASAAAAPVFHDLDEVAASTPNYKHPWWVKERELLKPTLDIQWDLMDSTFGRRDTTQHSNGKSVVRDYMAQEHGITVEEYDVLLGDKGKRTKAGLLAGEPQHSLRSQALGNSMGYRAREGGFMGPIVTSYQGSGIPYYNSQKTPESLGVPRWNGTPEENSQMVRAAMKLHGASEISIVELDPNNTRKLIYGSDRDNKVYEWADIDQPYETETKRVIPNKCKWLINFSFAQSKEAHIRGFSGGGTRYALGWQILLMSQCFVRGLGYLAVGPYNYINDLALNNAFSVLGGGGESSRNNQSISAIYGSVNGVCASFVTDLPLEPTNPIDAGISRFCYSCKKCAELCPGNISGYSALSMETEPTWEPLGPWNKAGREFWWFSPGGCNPFRDLCGGWGCATRCPFARGVLEAGIHELVSGTLATTSIFNGFFRNMDDVFYGKTLRDPDEFWSFNLPVFGFDSTKGM